MKEGQSFEIVQEIVKALGAEDKPIVHNDQMYRVIVFKASKTNQDTAKPWVAGMIPFSIVPEDLFEVINDSYGQFLIGVAEPNGVVFLCAEEPNELVTLASTWYNEQQQQPDRRKL